MDQTDLLPGFRLFGRILIELDDFHEIGKCASRITELQSGNRPSAEGFEVARVD
jgi:hypothetical protein